VDFLVPELIRKKRDGGRHSPEEIAFLVSGFAAGQIPDYQITAWLMSSFLVGLDNQETTSLTRAMKESGRSLEWKLNNSHLRTAGFKATALGPEARLADKHSTGGVGDKVSLVLAPLAACLGLKVPMMSGRGLGHTGGTVDKLESIPGFTMYPSEAQMRTGLREVGVVMMAQAEDLCPADRKLYSLRDVTATVESIPLITASIVSKKWAAGVESIVYDVKYGSGAFMSNLEQARKLARSLKRVSEEAGLRASALLTRMEEPLGAFIGNALEVRESLSILRGDESPLARPLRDLCLDLTAEMVFLSGAAGSTAGARETCDAALRDGQALERFLRMANLQGAEDGWESRLPVAPVRWALTSTESGHVASIQARALGLAGLRLGVGRRQAEDKVDPATGFEMAVAVGDRVKTGDTLLWIHARDEAQARGVETEVRAAFTFSSEAPAPLTRLFLERI